MKTIMIVGGGCFALSAALMLAEKGIDVQIVSPEKAKEIAPRPPILEYKIEKLPELTPLWMEGCSNNRADRRKRERQNKRKS